MRIARAVLAAFAIWPLGLSGSFAQVRERKICGAGFYGIAAEPLVRFLKRNGVRFEEAGCPAA